jgi:hypothetical protein
MGEVIKYTSENGYTGVLYGRSSMSIYDPEGHECLHTGFRNINTYEELVETVNEQPEFMKALENMRSEDDLDDESGDKE